MFTLIYKIHCMQCSILLHNTLLVSTSTLHCQCFNTNIPCLLVILSLQGLMKKCLFAAFWKSFTKDETQSKMCDIKKDSRHRVLFKLFLFGFNLLNVDDSLIHKKAMKIESTVFFKLHYQRWTLSNTNL
jgi:hypothetical protein